MIELKNVSKWYGSFQVLNDCSTSIQKGEVVVVCGPSGSGKSTLIKTINALEWPEGEGFVWAAGEHSEMAALRKIAVAKGASPKRMRIAAYWKQGESAHHAELVDQA